MGAVPNQPKTPIYGFRYPREKQDRIDALINRWRGRSQVTKTDIGTVAFDEFLEKYENSPVPPARLRDEGAK